LRVTGEEEVDIEPEVCFKRGTWCC